MKKLLMLSNIPSPYMVDYLNELGKLCDVTAIFEKESSSIRDKSWKDYNFKNFKGIILKGINIKVSDDDAAISPSVISYLKKDTYDYIVVGNPCTPTGMIAIFYMKLKKIPYCIQSEGGFAKDGKGFKENLKKKIFKDAHMYLSTGDIGDDYFVKYGANKDRIFRFPFSSLYDKDILENIISEKDKVKFKEELNITYKKIVISVGNFIERKGFEGLIKSFKGIDKQYGLYIIGGKPSEEYLNICKENNLDNVHFIDFVDRETIAKYYMASDVFALNTLYDTWGLVINEAMSYGLPVITTNECYAGLTLIKDNENGYIVKPNDIKELNNKIDLLLKNYDLRKSMGEKNLAIAKEYTLENMAKCIYDDLIKHY